MRHILVGSALATLLVSCGGGSLPTLCSFTSVPLPANELTLRSDARLDRTGPGFVLLATDKDQILVEPLGPAGQPGAMAVVPVPAHTDGPWVGVAGTVAAPATTLVVAYATNPAAGAADLMTFTIGLDGTGATPPVAIAKIPDKAVMPVVVAAGSGRAGTHVGLAWGVPGATPLAAKVLGPDGLPAGDVPIGPFADFDCLRFGPGKGDLTVTFTEQSPMTPPKQILHVNEIDGTGMAGPSFSLTLGQVATGCAEIAANPDGYALGWKEIGTQTAPGQGDFFAFFDQMVKSYVPSLVLSSARSVGGTAPPIVGVGTTGKRFTLVFAHAAGAEAWDVDFAGRQVAQSVTLPSSHGNIGGVSTQPATAGSFVTYADYASADPTDQTAGTRLFIELSCQ